VGILNRIEPRGADRENNAVRRKSPTVLQGSWYCFFLACWQIRVGSFERIRVAIADIVPLVGEIGLEIEVSSPPKRDAQVK
jgi:hypothetical protein